MACAGFYPGVKRFTKLVVRQKWDEHMALSKRKRRIAAKEKQQARQFWKILAIVTVVILIYLFISYMR
jgi:hypothetical protein